MDDAVKVLAREMFLGAKENFEYQIALIGAAQTRRLDVLDKDLFLRFEFIFLTRQNLPQ